MFSNGSYTPVYTFFYLFTAYILIKYFIIEKRSVRTMIGNVYCFPGDFFRETAAKPPLYKDQATSSSLVVTTTIMLHQSVEW